MINYQIEILEGLKTNNIISYDDVLNIIDAFQIASAQGYAVGKTKGILDFIKNYGKIVVTKIPNSDDLEIKTISDLSKLYSSIDKNINIDTDKIFATYYRV
jgi:hypothetical protein